jgi:hypothetical protein
MHTWEIGNEAWCCYFDADSDGYVGKRLGRVSAIGIAGVTVVLATPDPEGRTLARLAFHDVWPSKAAVDAEIASRPRRRHL